MYILGVLSLDDPQALLFMIFIGIASNLDNAGIGIAYGIRNVRITPFANAIISFLNGLATLVAGIFGNWFSLWLSAFMANLLGVLILVTLGLKLIIGNLFQPTKSSQSKDTMSPTLLHSFTDKADKISLLETLILGFALSVTNLVAGFDAGLYQLNIWLTSFFAMLFSYINIAVFIYLGSKFSKKHLEKHTTIIAGSLLIIIGISQAIA